MYNFDILFLPKPSIKGKSLRKENGKTTVKRSIFLKSQPSKICASFYLCLSNAYPKQVSPINHLRFRITFSSRVRVWRTSGRNKERELLYSSHLSFVFHPKPNMRSKSEALTPMTRERASCLWKMLISRKKNSIVLFSQISMFHTLHTKTKVISAHWSVFLYCSL